MILAKKEVDNHGDDRNENQDLNGDCQNSAWSDFQSVQKF